MKPYEDLLAAAREGSPFSNSTEWEIWSYNWCEECTKDSPEMVDRGEGCPLILIAMMGQTPAEWSGERGDYHCSEFDRRDDGGPDDDPEPEPGPGPFTEEMPGQTDIFTFIVEDALENMPAVSHATA